VSLADRRGQLSPFVSEPASPLRPQVSVSRIKANAASILDGIARLVYRSMMI
jgi:hypothetical protein